MDFYQGPVENCSSGRGNITASTSIRLKFPSTMRNWCLIKTP
ncbi:Protein of unknown function [Pyronema omphalodes CBS 100304]|uniref:Uncharacterized protein n=1 Tax=Pyronema omphalodes (strain CBS 100304) TaxID=1076935 RepID=U4LP43_PYROM|nr:Protein of unknown function [Pyronema omphalodes CBS 100304]